MVKGAKKAKKVTKRGDNRKRNPLFEKTPRNFRIGGDLQHERDLTRFMRWPRYIMIQRQKRILFQRMKVPPAIHQFQKILDKNQSSSLLKLLNKYKPETKLQKKERLLAEAKKQKEAEVPKETKMQEEKKQPKKKEEKTKTNIAEIKYGLNHITTLIEQKKAKLVIIAHDVDPIELVLWMPQLCRKMDVPFCFMRNKAKLGQLVGKKTASCIALVSVRKEDQAEFDMYVNNYRAIYNDNLEMRKEWSKGQVGIKAQHRIEKQEKAKEQELIKKQR